MAASSSTFRPFGLKKAVAFRGIYFAQTEAELADASAPGINIGSDLSWDFDLIDDLADAWNLKQGSNSYIKAVTSNGSEKLVFGKITEHDGGIDCDGALDLDHALTAAGDFANIAGTINHATADAEAVDGTIAQLTTNRTGGVVAGLKGDTTSLAGDTGGYFATVKHSATDGGGTGPVHTVIYGEDAADYLVVAAASGDCGVVIGSDAMTADPETDTEDGYVLYFVSGAAYASPIYAQ